MLFELSPIDPLTHAAAMLLVIATSLIVCWLPARRSAKVDPMVALRCD
jgi:ABC-type antimicrobial peptide transport system permease subunit